MKVTLDMLRTMVGGKISAAQVGNMTSVIAGLDAFGSKAGLDQPHRLAHYLPQLMHESANFKYDREIWGPTPAQKRYEGRKDLGNTQPGDGKRFAGRGPIQITGRSNYRQFTAWAQRLSASAPNFEIKPDAVNSDPWEGIGPIWYWDTRDLNKYADRGDIEMVTKRINGGLNGYADRVAKYERVALVLLGFAPDDVKGFQGKHGLKVDGITGPRTRAAMHKALLAYSGPSADIAIAPVVEEVDKPTVPATTEQEASKPVGRWQWLTGLLSGAGAGLAGLAGLDWQTVAAIAGAGVVLIIVLVILRRQIADAIGLVRKEVEAGQ